MLMLLRTDLSGTPISEPLCIERNGIPLSYSKYFSTKYERNYLHLVNHSYSADDKHPLFKTVIHAVYTLEEII